MKPNIFLILLDSLRADTIFTKNKTCITPNLDHLISHGTSFTSAFSTADHTGISWLAILRAIFPSISNVNPYKFDSNIETFVEIFKENNFKTFCFFPDISFFNILSKKFDDSLIYEYSEREQYQKFKEKYFDELLKNIKLQNHSNSYFNCIHLMDLKYPYSIPKQFDNTNFGKNRQDRMLSYLDQKMGELIKSIDIENSIIIFSSDHGDYIPPTGKNLDEIPKIQEILKKGKNIVPSLEPLGIEVFKFLKKSNKSFNSLKSKNKFSDIQKRGFLNRNESYLFDDTINVPLIFSGKNIKNQKISTLVRHVDIMPTISKFLNLKFNDSKYDGKDISESFVGKTINELTAYFESGPANATLEGQVIGIRNSKFKYFRSRKDKKLNVNLYDLKNDKNEERNIAEIMPKIVIEMESELSKFFSPENEKNNLKRSINKKISKLKLD
jgi:arylsulfatase A-like enzyme